MAERRAYERLGVIGEVELSCPGAAASLRKGRLENISFGGFTVSLDEALKPDEAIDFVLNVASTGEAVSGKGVVRCATERLRHNRKIFIIGVKFTRVNKDILTYIIKKIQTKTAQERRVKGQGDTASFIPY